MGNFKYGRNTASKPFIRRVIAAFALVLLASNAAASLIALESTRGTGNQSTFFGSLGMSFRVISPISVQALGAFDSGQNGISSNGIQVGIYDIGGTLVPGLSTTITSADALDGQSRFKDISHVMLDVGDYMLVSWGHGGSEPNGNAGTSGPGPTINDGGLIQFLASYYHPAAGAFPTIPDGAPPARYDAGTFKFEAVPVPAPLALIATGAMALVFRAKK